MTPNHYRRRRHRILTPTGEAVAVLAAIFVAGACGRWLQLLVEWLS